MKNLDFEIDISNRQSSLHFDEGVLRAAVLKALALEQVSSAVLSISIVDNSAIHVINRDHLQHNYPTDVISFQLDFVPADELEAEYAVADEAEDEDEDFSDEQGAPFDLADDLSSGALLSEGRAAGAAIEGEIIASAEMAVSMASEGKWSAEAELILYVVHGLLHICGYDDLSPDEKSIMRNRERSILSELGLTAIYAEDAEEDRH